MKNNLNAYKTIYIAFFFGIFISLKKIFYQIDLDDLLISGFLGAFGIFVGFLFYKLMENRKTYIKIGFLILCLISTLLYVRLNSFNKEVKIDKILEKGNVRLDNSYKIDSSKLKTCDICGYIAAYPDSGFCLNCKTTILDSLTNDSMFNSQCLVDNQLFWFSYDIIDNKVNFFKPQKQKGFLKDTNWRPIVTEKEVLRYKKEHPSFY